MKKQDKSITQYSKRIMSATLLTTMLASPLNVLAAAPKDIQGHWAESTIKTWQDRGYIKGFPDGSFKPDTSITRAEFVRILNQSLTLRKTGKITFSDITTKDWFYNDISIAVGEGYTSGFSDGTFKPNSNVTRAQACVLIAKAIKADGGAVNFKDATQIPTWAKNSVEALATKGFISGHPDGNFKPNTFLTRAEAVSILNRVMQASVGAPPQGGALRRQPGASVGAAATTKTVRTTQELIDAVKDNTIQVINVNGDISGNVNLTRTGRTNFTINFDRYKRISSLTITAPDVSSITLNDSAAGAAGAQVSNLTIDAPKAHVENYVAVTGTTTIKAVASSTFVARDTMNSIEVVGQGKLSLESTSNKPKVTVKTEKPVILTGTMGEVDVAKDKAAITISGNVDTLSATAANVKITTSNADIKLLKTAKNITVEGTNGTVRTLQATADNVTVTLQNGVTVQTASVANGLQPDRLKFEGTGKKPARVEKNADALAGVSFREDVNNSSKTIITLPVDGVNKYKYKISDNSSAVPTPFADATLPSDWRDIRNNDSITTTNGKNIGIAKVNAQNKVVSFVNLTAVVRDENVTAIKAELAKLNAKVSVDTGKQIVQKITELKAKLSAESFRGIPDIHKFTTLQKELQTVDTINANKTVTLNDKGVVQWSNNIQTVMTATLKKQGDATTVATKKTNANDTSVSFVQEMRAKGLGTYSVTLVPEFTLLNNALSLTSTTQEVKALSRITKATAYNAQFQATSSGDATLDFDKKLLMWKAIPNATSYDIYVELTASNTEGMLGTYYTVLGQDGNGTHAENAFHTRTLTVKNNYIDEQPIGHGALVIAASNVKTTQVPMNNLFVPSDWFKKVVGNSGYFNSSIMFTRLWIIPRNENSLYISNVYAAPTTNLTLSNIPEAIIVANYKVSDYWTKLVGVEPPVTTPPAPAKQDINSWSTNTFPTWTLGAQLPATLSTNGNATIKAVNIVWNKSDGAEASTIEDGQSYTATIELTAADTHKFTQAATRAVTIQDAAGKSYTSTEVKLSNNNTKLTFKVKLDKPATPTLESDFQMTGTPKIDETLTLNTRKYANGYTLAYTWYRSDDAAGKVNKAKIVGVNANTYTLRKDDLGKYMLAEVTLKKVSSDDTIGPFTVKSTEKIGKKAGEKVTPLGAAITATFSGDTVTISNVRSKDTYTLKYALETSVGTNTYSNYQNLTIGEHSVSFRVNNDSSNPIIGRKIKIKYTPKVDTYQEDGVESTFTIAATISA